MFKHLALNRNVLALHGTVLIWGFTGVLGNLISIDAVHLVWYRVLIAFMGLLIYMIARRQNMRINLRDLLLILGVGAIIGLHWFFFFQSIKVANVSVGLVSISSVTLFTAILEPIFHKKKLSKLEIVIGIMIIAGILTIFSFESKYTLGISLGLVGAICASIFSIMNSKLVKRHDPKLISLYEMLGALIVASLYLGASSGFSTGMTLSKADLVYLLILGLICTSVAYVVAVDVMKELSAFRVALATNLEPIYGILLAFMIFGKAEHMTAGFYLGGFIIIGAIFLYSYLRSEAFTLLRKKRLGKGSFAG